ncbi:MAG: hypothetical protein KatS3mg108_3366 [Isosphaeraceae bacterium]|jgi:hypothetical protein|nr:MAG: hypothetical protein KatS3mg108_3366 [Isosphaeraceae bacterium]
MTNRRTFLAGGLAATVFGGATRSDGAREAEPRRVILVTLDGLRWQEVFRGADAELMERTGGNAAAAESIRATFWNDSPEQRRRILMPFVWEVVARRGQLLGDRDRGDEVVLTNGLKFSYPGYNEMLTGAADPRINSNQKIPNPNRNVLEWLHGRPGLTGRVAAFCSWDVFPFILNRERSGLPVQAGWEPIAGEPVDPRRATINALYEGLHREWDNNVYDALTFESALAHLEAEDPRVIYVAVGETDEHAHHDRYDFYLRAARRADAQIRRLWEASEANPAWRGRTSLILTTDHGRGEGRLWTSHGQNIEGAEFIWIGLLGPGIEPRGADAPAVRATQAQIAATVAALAGEDLRSDVPQAAPPLVEAVGAAR